MSSAQTARQVQGYLAATERPSCRNCMRGQEQRPDRSPPWDKPWWRCMRGGFTVTAGGICERHEPRPKPVEAPK